MESVVHYTTLVVLDASHNVGTRDVTGPQKEMFTIRPISR